jgi:S1-C subfamily serine protease
MSNQVMNNFKQINVQWVSMLTLSTVPLLVSSSAAFALGPSSNSGSTTTASMTVKVPSPAASHKIVTVSKQAAAVEPSAPPISPDEAITIRVYKNANRAVVNIANISLSEDQFNVMPREGNGSGTIISSDGYILTNFHVIDNAQQLRVTLFDGKVLPPSVVGTDPANDLAVLKITPPAGTVLTTIPFGDSSKLEVGRRVLAIGNPFGYDRTLTQGIVSSLGRTLKTPSGRIVKGIIQTDAAINPGNSGGPLLDTAGKLVGINTAIFTRTGQSAGISFAIPINIAKHIVPELIANHGITRPDLGIQAVQVVDNGLRVINLDPEGPAAKAGLSGPKLTLYREGAFTFQNIDVTVADIITSIDNTVVHSADDLLSYIELKKPGQVVTLTVLRGGKAVKIAVKLASSNSV